MANPDPKALQAAAASMAAQAKAARDTMISERVRRESELGRTQHEAKLQEDLAQRTVDDRAYMVKHDQEVIDNNRKQGDDSDKQAADADRAGNSAQAAELRETAAHQRALADSVEAAMKQEQQELADAKVALAERTRDADAAAHTWREYEGDLDRAEQHIDAMENKAKMLAEAGRKLELAPTIDNPVERATLELDAEKLLEDANAIQLDTTAITTVTGQDVQLPDPAAPQPDPATPDAAGDDGDHLDDPFAAATSTDGGSSDTVAPAADPFADDITGAPAAESVQADAVVGVAVADPMDTSSAPVPDPQTDTFTLDEGAAATPDLTAEPAGDFAAVDAADGAGVDDTSAVDDGL